MNSYRRDCRNVKEFARDIKDSHTKELEIALRIAVLMHSETGRWPTIEATGSDFTGEFIEKDSLVDITPDFKIDGVSFEITRADPLCNRYFHQKMPKILRALKDRTNLVFVNGFIMSATPEFVIIKPEDLEIHTSKALAKYGEVGHPTRGGGFVSKVSYRYDLSWFAGTWKNLPVLTDEARKQYKALLELMNA